MYDIPRKSSENLSDDCASFAYEVQMTLSGMNSSPRGLNSIIRIPWEYSEYKGDPGVRISGVIRARNGAWLTAAPSEQIPHRISIQFWSPEPQWWNPCPVRCCSCYWSCSKTWARLRPPTADREQDVIGLLTGTFDLITWLIDGSSNVPPYWAGSWVASISSSRADFQLSESHPKTRILLIVTSCRNGCRMEKATVKILGAAASGSTDAMSQLVTQSSNNPLPLIIKTRRMRSG